MYEGHSGLRAWGGVPVYTKSHLIDVPSPSSIQYNLAIIIYYFASEW